MMLPDSLFLWTAMHGGCFSSLNCLHSLFDVFLDKTYSLAYTTYAYIV